MPLRGALRVRVSDGQSDRMVTRYARGLRFTKVAPGGHQSIQCSAVFPKGMFGDLGPEDRIWVHDARTGSPVIEGYLENPTPVNGPQGQQYDLSAVGGMALASDEARALVYVDRAVDSFERADNSAAGATVEQGSQIDGTNVTGVQVQFPSGQPIGTGSLASAGNYIFERAGMNLGGVHARILSGKNDAGYAQEMATFTQIVPSGNATTTPGTFLVFVGDNFDPTNRFAFRLRRTGGATNIADDVTWMRATDISVIGQRVDREGTSLVGAAGLVSAEWVLASHVVEDLLGRLMTFCDSVSAVVETTTWEIDQLSYPDGAKAAQVLTDLALWEPDYLWEILEALDNGKHRFAFRAWPTTARYEVSVRDGWRQAGSDSDLCNRVLVSWVDEAGKKQTLAVSTDDMDPDIDTPLGADGQSLGRGHPIDALTASGRIKDADPVTLPEGFGSAANALKIGVSILRDKVNPPKAGVVTVRRPIMDRLTGRLVMPWELEPGYLCRLRETGEELRVTQMEYADDSVSATLTLGTPVLTESQRIARLDAA